MYEHLAEIIASIDSAPLQKSYMTAMEIWFLERV